MSATTATIRLRSKLLSAVDASLPFLVALLATAVLLGLVLLSAYSIVPQIILTVAVVVLGLVIAVRSNFLR